VVANATLARVIWYSVLITMSATVLFAWLFKLRVSLWIKRSAYV